MAHPLPYQALAQHLLSGAHGVTLSDELAAKFPSISRADVFMGIALAWSCLQADEVILHAEIADLRRQLAEKS